MRLRPHGNRDRRKGNRRRRNERHHWRRARIHLARSERQDEPLSRSGSLARRASRRPLHDDDRDRRDSGGALPSDATEAGRVRAAIATKNRGSPGRRPLRRRDRAFEHCDEGRRQGDRRRLGQGRDIEAGRRAARRHELGRPFGAEAGVRRRAAGQGGLVRHRRQRLAALRRRERLRIDGGQTRQPAQP